MFVPRLLVAVCSQHPLFELNYGKLGAEIEEGARNEQRSRRAR
jgi:hypothetical protein